MNDAVIQSKQNKSFKEWTKLLTSKGRKKSQTYLIEGHHLIEEALEAHVKIKHLILTEVNYTKYDQKTDVPLTLISEALAKELSTTEQPQGVFAEVEMSATGTLPETGSRFLLVDAVQDPGNLGTMIRTADAAAYDAVILGTGTVDVYNDKVLRATQGSLWHLPVVSMNLSEAIKTLQGRGVAVFATALNQNARSYKEISSNPAGLGLIVGNEGSGVGLEYIDQADAAIYIPMPGSAESLNVSVATGILIFEFVNIDKSDSK